MQQCVCCLIQVGLCSANPFGRQKLKRRNRGNKKAVSRYSLPKAQRWFNDPSSMMGMKCRCPARAFRTHLKSGREEIDNTARFRVTLSCFLVLRKPYPETRRETMKRPATTMLSACRFPCSPDRSIQVYIHSNIKK